MYPFIFNAHGGVSVLNDLSDVNAPSPTNRDSLLWDSISTKWTKQSMSGLASYIGDELGLDELHDVNTPSPTDDQALAWDAGTSKWIPQTLGVGGTYIQDADADTKIQTEESADEDKIRMDTAGTEAFLLDDAGVLTLAKQSSARMESTVQQSVPNATWTKVNYNSEAWDIQNEADLTNDKITVTVTGTYMVTMQSTIYNMPDGTVMIAEIRLNGTSAVVAGARNCMCYTNAAAMPLVAGIYQLSATDYIQGYVYQNSGSAKALSQYASQNYLALTKIA